ncbi:MAG: transposase [Leptospiraceae bacterium]|nr:transposase [Leptospiraceae bacterium]
MEELGKENRIEAFQRGDVAWYEDEFLDLNLGDSRLDKRLGIIMNYRMQNPSSSMPDTFVSWDKTKAAYRFFQITKLILN